MAVLLLTMMMERESFPKSINVWALFLYDKVDCTLDAMMIMVVMLRVVSIVVMVVMATIQPPHLW